MQVSERVFDDRRAAGASLLSKLRLAAMEGAMADWIIGRIGCFKL